MASFNATGIDGLRLSLEELADLPEAVLLDMLEAEGEVVKRAQSGQLAAFARTHQLEQSISVSGKLKRNRTGTPGISVYPQGVRRDGRTRNAEVGFIQEYGAPRRGIKPAQWMRKANAKAEEEAVRAAEKVYQDWLDGLGL